MPGWLEPVARKLDAAPGPIRIFFRNDDAGWDNERLFRLLQLFARHRCPIDLAVIPAALAPKLADELLRQLHAGATIGLHQHGFMHLNHEPVGRPCEFGPSRPVEAQRRDIEAGQQALIECFGPFLDPFFTPPWNRCTAATEACVRDSGLTAISRDRTAGPVTVAGLGDCSIGIDWFARARGARLVRERWGERMAEEIGGASAPLGVMLHHAQMDRSELNALDELLTVCRASGRFQPLLMRDAVSDIRRDKGQVS